MARAGAMLDRSIGERFDEIAAVNSRRVAIRTPRGEIHYGALASLSDRIALRVCECLAHRNAAAPVPAHSLLSPLAAGAALGFARDSAELFKAAEGLDIVEISYKGAPPALVDLLAGRIPEILGDIERFGGIVKAVGMDVRP